MIEVTTFRLRDGVDEATFAAADAAAQAEFFYQQHGLVRRTTARAADGEWVTVTLWGSADTAEAAASALADAPAGSAARAFLDCIDEPMSVRRYEPLPG